MSAFKRNSPECSTCTCGGSTTTLGAGCRGICPGGIPISITITNVPPGGFVFSLPFIVCKFSPTGSGETITDSNLTRAHGTPLNSWWSDHISDGSGGYFQFCFSCGPPSGASHGFASMATMHNFRGPGLGADFAQNYNFDLLTCSPFLATGEFDPSTSQKWAASG